MALRLTCRRQALRNSLIGVGLMLAALSGLIQPVHAATLDEQPAAGAVAMSAMPQEWTDSEASHDLVQAATVVTDFVVPDMARNAPGLPADQAANPAIRMVYGKVSTAITSASILAAPELPPSSALQAGREEALQLKFEALDDLGRITPGCSLASLNSQGQRGAVSCLFADLSTGINISSQTGDFESHATFVRGFQNPWTSQSLLTSDMRGLGEESTVAMFGFSGSLLNNRLTIRSDLAWSTRWQTPLYALPVPLSQLNQRTGTASWYGIEAKLVQLPRLSWSVSADYSSVGDEFFIGQGTYLRRAIALPGERLTLASTLKLGQMRFTTSNDRYRTSFGNSTSSRFGFSSNGISFGLAARSFESVPIAGFSLYSSRTHTLTGTLDLSVDSATSGLLADFGRSPLFPRTVSLSWRSGWTENSVAETMDRYLRKAWSISVGWETRFGETSFDYSQDRRIGATAQLGIRTDETIQLSHMVRWSGWRAGLDGMINRNASSNAVGYHQTNYSAGATLAYQRVDGPEFALRIGHDRDRMRLNNRSYLSANDGLRLTTSLDLTSYLNKQMDREDLRLRIEYRKLLEAQNEDLLDPELVLIDHLFERLDRDVFQISFGMKL